MPGPDSFQADANGRQNGNVENGQQRFGDVLFGGNIQGDAAETEIHHTRAIAGLVAQHRVSVGAGHGNAFGFARNRIDASFRGFERKRWLGDLQRGNCHGRGRLWRCSSRRRNDFRRNDVGRSSHGWRRNFRSWLWRGYGFANGNRSGGSNSSFGDFGRRSLPAHNLRFRRRNRGNLSTWWRLDGSFGNHNWWR